MYKFKRKIHRIKITLFVSKSRYADDFIYKSYRQEYKGDNVREMLVYSFYPNKYLLKSINNLISDMKSMAILHAHGGKINNVWVYQDETFFYKKFKSIQDWINKNDGKYDILFITACNGAQFEIKSKKSIIVHAKKDFSLNDLMSHKIKLYIYIPNKGYI